MRKFSCGHEVTFVEIFETIHISDSVKAEVSKFGDKEVILSPKESPEFSKLAVSVSGDVVKGLSEAIQRLPAGSNATVYGNVTVYRNVTNLIIGDRNTIEQTNIVSIIDSFNEQIKDCNALDADAKVKALSEARELGEGAANGSLTFSRARELISSLTSLTASCAVLAPYISQLVTYVQHMLGM